MQNVITIISIHYFLPIMLLCTWFSTVLVNALVDEPYDRRGKFGLFCLRKRKAILIGIAILFVVEFLVRNVK